MDHVFVGNTFGITVVTAPSSAGFVSLPEGLCSADRWFEKGPHRCSTVSCNQECVYIMLGSADGWKKGQEGEKNEGAPTF